MPHSVRHIVLPPNALLGRQNEEVVKVFLYFFRQCCAAALTTAENAARQCKFSARVKGVALAAVQRQSAGRAERETIPLFFTPARVRTGWWKRTISF